MKPKFIPWIAIGLILVTGWLHFITAASEASEAFYMGWLFILNFLASLVSAVGIFRRKLWWGWGLGVFVAAGSILGYILSRTVGMPGMEVEEWADPIGIPAMIVEGAFLVLFFLEKPWQTDLAGFVKTAKSPQVAIPAMMLTVMMFSLVSYQVGARSNSHGGHPLPDTILTEQALEEQYGIKLELVALTAAGGLVDVRYRVLDPDKAAQLVSDGGIMPMLHVDDTDFVLVPDAHMRTQKLVKGRMYFALIPNSQNVVKRGTPVTVAFGDVAVQPVATR